MFEHTNKTQLMFNVVYYLTVPAYNTNCDFVKLHLCISVSYIMIVM